MILSGDFYYHSLLRWNLAWPTPNYAGAFVAALLAIAFTFSGSRWRWAALAIEAGGLFLLAKTYSRGAVVAWGVAWLFGFAVSRGWRSSSQLALWLARIGALAALLLVVGFGWSRADVGRKAVEGPAQEDGSVANRLTLWRGGLEMIAIAPIRGWGAGASGRSYMNWLQEIDRREGYTTMVNSYLHVGVERGLPVLGGSLCVLAWLVATAWRIARSRDDDIGIPGLFGIPGAAWAGAAGASLVAWMTANVFTTLWIEPKLWIVPAIAAFVIVWQGAWNGIGHFRLASQSLGVALVGVAVLYAAGLWLSRTEPLRPVPGAFGRVVLTLPNFSPATGEVWHAWPDTAVLSSTPGKELRRWLGQQSVPVELIVHRAAPLQRGEVSGRVEGVMLFGRQVERWGAESVPVGRELWLVHPLTAPPELPGVPLVKKPSSVIVVLPAIDEMGQGEAWRRWARSTGARVIESSGGTDIRAAWPAVMAANDLPTANRSGPPDNSRTRVRL